MGVTCYHDSMNADQLGLLLATATICAALQAKGHVAESNMYKFRLAQALRAAGYDPDEVYDSIVKHMEDPRV